MPTKNQRKGDLYEFVDIRLNGADQDKFRDWYKAGGSKVFELLTEILLQGYKLSLTYDENNKCYIASMTCRDQKNSNFGYVLTSRSDDYWEAIALELYKHTEMCDDGDWAPTERQSPRSWG